MYVSCCFATASKVSICVTCGGSGSWSCCQKSPEVRLGKTQARTTHRPPTSCCARNPSTLACDWHPAPPRPTPSSPPPPPLLLLHPRQQHPPSPPPTATTTTSTNGCVCLRLSALYASTAHGTTKLWRCVCVDRTSVRFAVQVPVHSCAKLRHGGGA